MAMRKVVVTLPEDLFDLVERVRKAEQRSRSEIIQEAIRTHFGEAAYAPIDDERRLLLYALDTDDLDPGEARRWSDVRRQLGGAQ